MTKTSGIPLTVLVPALVFGLGLALLMGGGCQQAKTPAYEGMAPDFLLLGVDGSMVKLSDFPGKVVLLDFWATWCTPCRELIPNLAELHKRYADRGLVILGIAVDQEGLRVVKPFIEANPVPYRILIGDGKVEEAFGKVESIPTLFVVDREGRLVRKLVGYHPLEQLEEEVNKYL